MNTAIIRTSLFAALAISSLNAGTLNLSGGGNVSTTEYKQLNPNANDGIPLDGILYRAEISNPSSVSDAALEFDFSDTNLTEDVLKGTYIVNVDENGTKTDDGNKTILSFSQLTEKKIASYKKLNKDTGIIDTEKYYAIRANNQGTATNIFYKIKNDKTISLKVFSTSGNATEEDNATQTIKEGTTKDQFKFACQAKFDGLINFENLSRTFVPTGHDHNASETQDTLVFTIDNNDNGINNSVDGNGTEVIIATDVNLTALGFTDADITLSGLDSNGNEQNGTGTIINGGYDINFTITDAIPTGRSTWYATIAESNSSTLKATKFTMASVNLEGNNTVHPAIDYTAGIDVGEWKDYAFIAQIPAGESGGAANMITKYYITNRSCKTVTPQIAVVYDGKVYQAENVAELPVNTQGIYRLKDIMKSIPDLSTVWNTNTSTKASVEITIPGVAEDFYIYAQVKNGTLKQFKDLPVYNTSKRD